MSYILDALRKADQLRQNGKPPTLHSAMPLPKSPHPWRVMLNVGLAAGLIVIGILIGWMQPWQDPPPSPASRQVIESSPMTRLEPPEKSLPERPVVTETPTASLQPGPIQAAQNPGTSTIRKYPQEAATAAAFQDSKHPDSDIQATARTDKVSGAMLAELPAAIKQQLPEIAIAFHQYSEHPSERRVMINNLLLKQGDAIAPGLTLEKITPEGVTLNYLGYPFARGVR